MGEASASQSSKEKSLKSELGAVEKAAKDCEKDLDDKRKELSGFEVSHADIMKTHRTAHEKSMKDVEDAHDQKMADIAKKLEELAADNKKNKVDLDECNKNLAGAEGEAAGKASASEDATAAVSKLTSVLKENQVKANSYASRVVTKSTEIENRVNALRKRMEQGTKEIKEVLGN